MFAYIIGKVTNLFDNSVILENNNIGYNINVSKFTKDCMVEFLNQEVKLYTYFQVKEDGFSLYGFFSLDEKEIFLNLISVSGVGPKAAITILSNITPTDLAVCIASENTNALSSVKGIGKKTAERIIIELKDKVKELEVNCEVKTFATDTKAIDEACLTLISLGVNKATALTLARENATETSTAEEIIGKALRSMNNI